MVTLPGGARFAACIRSLRCLFMRVFVSPGMNDDQSPLADTSTRLRLGMINVLLPLRGNNTFIIPSLNLVLVSANGDWSSFIPGDTNTRMNRHLKLLMQAANRAPPGNVTIQRFHTHDFSLSATAEGNPFDVDLAAEFTGPENTRLRVPGFYDGNGTWKIRFAHTIERT